MNAACTAVAARAHPRACGENLTALTAELAMFGSSPRVRGKRGLDLDVNGSDGLIPARAGKTRARIRGA